MLKLVGVTSLFEYIAAGMAPLRELLGVRPRFSRRMFANLVRAALCDSAAESIMAGDRPN